MQYATDGSLYPLPGGTVEAGEVSGAAIEREMAEEYGITAHVERLVTTWERLLTFAAVNGGPGVVVTADGRIVSVMAFTIAEGRIVPSTHSAIPIGSDVPYQRNG